MKSAFIVILASLAAFSAAPVSADRIIFAPTGTVLGTGEIRAEAAAKASNSDSKVYWAGIGLPRLELNAMRLQGGTIFPGAENADVIGAEVAVLPETTLTPGIGLGLWDITKQTNEGRGYYLAVTKLLPLTKEAPLPLRDIRVHVGFGVQGIEGLFGGADAAIPFGLRLSAEYFQKDVNLALAWRIVPGVQLKGYLMDGDVFYGLQVSLPL